MASVRIRNARGSKAPPETDSIPSDPAVAEAGHAAPSARRRLQPSAAEARDGDRETLRAEDDLRVPHYGQARAALGLPALGHDPERRTGDDEVEQAPQADDEHQAGDARLVQVPPGRRRAAGGERAEDREERPGQRREVIALQAHALVGDV